MLIQDKIVVVTGGAQGIGRALALACHRAGARKVIIGDLDERGARQSADMIGGLGFGCDVGREEDVRALITQAETKAGPIDLFCSNAGIAEFDPNPNNAASASNDAYQRSWAVNVMAHIYAARALVPLFAARGGGYFLNTVSAAGLLSQIGSGPYSATKHAAIGFAEHLAIAHRRDGIKVSVLCPQAVDTAMLKSAPAGPQSLDGVLSPETVAEIVLKGLAEERFLILPHPEVGEYRALKAADYDRWLAGMSKLKSRLSVPPA